MNPIRYRTLAALPLLGSVALAQHDQPTYAVTEVWHRADKPSPQ